MSLTISTIINGTLSLIRSYNPVTITGTGGVKATAPGADAIDGNSATAWAISNAGTMRKLLKKQGFAPDVLVTDKLRSYGAAKSEIGLSARYEQGLRKNNRAENSHRPTRRRERKMQRFKSPGSAQRFLSIHAVVQNIHMGRVRSRVMFSFS
jgi:DDE domain